MASLQESRLWAEVASFEVIDRGVWLGSWPVIPIPDDHGEWAERHRMLGHRDDILGPDRAVDERLGAVPDHVAAGIQAPQAEVFPPQVDGRADERPSLDRLHRSSLALDRASGISMPEQEFLAVEDRP